MSSIPSGGGVVPDPKALELGTTKEQATGTIGGVQRCRPVSKEERATLPGLEHDPRFYVAIMKPSVAFIARPFTGSYYVSLGGKDVNINSLAKTLLLDKSEIKKAAQEGTLDALARERSASFTKHKDAYETIFKNYEAASVEKGMLRLETRGGAQHEAGLTAATLMKVVQSAYKELDLGNKAITEKGIVIPEGGGQVLAKLEPVGKSHKLYVVNLDPKKMEQVGEGNIGTVYKVANLATGRFEAFKVARTYQNEAFAYSKRELAKQSVAREAGAMNDLAAETTGEKTAVFVDVQHPTQGGKKIVGFLSTLMEEDLAHWMDKPHDPKSMDEAAGQLISQFATMGQKMRHGDIKPENMLTGTVNGRQVFQMADLDVQKYDDPSFKPKVGSVTKPYLSLSDYTALKELEKKCEGAEKKMKKGVKGSEESKATKSEYDQNRDKFKELAKAQDVFAFGASLFDLYVQRKGRAYLGVNEQEDKEKNTMGWRDTTSPFDPDGLLLKARGGSENDPVYQLIKSMCDPDPSKRPTAGEVERRWNGIQQSNA